MQGLHQPVNILYMAEQHAHANLHSPNASQTFLASLRNVVSLYSIR